MLSSTQLRYKDGLWPFVFALSYGLVGYTIGLVWIAMPSMAINLCGLLLLTHTLVICAYMIHECAHNTLFAKNHHNAVLGSILSWITGSCYARYEDLRRKHFRHHVERADVIGFDYRPRIAGHPQLKGLIAALEWAYIPAVEIMLHALVILLPFRDARYKSSRGRVLGVLAVRATLFMAMGLVSFRALILYAVAYMLFLIVLRFMDANQHTYDLLEVHDDQPPPSNELRDRLYEQRNTYSNPISLRFPALNLLTLNFAYHNAHHDHPTVPWYRLPALHQELYGDDCGHVLPFGVLLRAYHKYRVPRAFRPLPTDAKSHVDRGPDLQGIDGISFLIPI